MSKPRGKRAARANHPRNAPQRESFQRVRERELNLGAWPLPESPNPLREQPLPNRRTS